MREGLKVHRSVKTRLEGAALEQLLLDYAPQVRPNFPGKHSEPTQLTREEWNIEEPAFWEWAD